MLQFLLAFLLVFAHGALANLHWDYLVFTQRWEPTLCKFDRCAKQPNADWFSIHGLWPNLWSKKPPTHCNPSPAFDQSRLEPILSELNLRWPDLLRAGTSYSFWKHEWDSHGRCAIEDELMPTELDYFKVGLQLNERFPIHQILSSVGIVPKNGLRLKTEDVLRHLQTHLGVRPELFCLKHKGQDAMIFEVRICLTASLETMDCPASDAEVSFTEVVDEDHIQRHCPAGTQLDDSFSNCPTLTGAHAQKCPTELIFPELH